MSTPNPVVQAAIPTAITALTAIQTFLSSLGTDPAGVAVKFPGAVQVLLGTLEMQLPALANSELGAVQNLANQRLAALITSLQKQQAAPAS